MNKERFIIEFADIRIRFELPTEVNLPREVAYFQVGDAENIDAEYYVKLIEEPLRSIGKYVATAGNMDIYEEKKGWLRIYTPLIEENGCQVACRLTLEQKNTLYYPKERWWFYSKELNLLHLIGIEEVLIKNDAFLLHSSVVKVQGQVVLFCGPSGVGKSTQAELWKKYQGAEILNGDRCIVKNNAERFYGCSSPWCGTSGIYRKEQAPIKGVFVLKQALQNSVRRMKSEAFSVILQNSVVNSWNADFMNQITNLIIKILMTVPIYELECRPDEEAVKLAYNTLFEGEN